VFRSVALDMDKYIQRIETEDPLVIGQRHRQPNPNSIRYIAVGDLEYSFVSVSIYLDPKLGLTT